MKKWFSSLGVWQIFGALLLVITVMAASNWIVHRNSISDIYKKLTDHNSLSVKYMIQKFDERYRAIHRLINAIHSLPYDNLLDQDGAVDMARVYSLQRQVESLVSSLDGVEEVVVFYRDVPIVITSKGTSSLEHLFGTKYRHPVHDALYWEKFLASRRDFTVFPAEDFTVLSNTAPEYRNRKLMAIASGNRMALSGKNILVLVDVDVWLQQVNRAGLIPGASLVVLDQNYRYLMGTELDWDLAGVIQESLDQNRREFSVTRGNYEYYIYQSDFNGFIYIERVPYQFHNLSSVTRANQAIIGISVLGAVLLSVVLSVYLNRPVQHILRLLGGGHSKGNDFRKIFTGIVKLQRENAAYREQLGFVDRELKRAAFLRLLEGRPLAEAEERELEAFKPELLRQRYFAMAALELEPLAEAPEEDPATAEALAARLQKGLFSAGLNAQVIHERGFRFLALVDLNETGGRERLLRLVNEVVRGLENGGPASWRIRGSLSRVYPSDFRHVREAHREARLGLMHHPAAGGSAVTDAGEWRNPGGIPVSFEELEKLSNSLLGGKTGDAQDIIRKAFAKLEERRSGRHAAALAANTLFYHMLKLAGDLGLDHDAMQELERRFHQAAEDAFSVRRAEQALLDAAAAIGARGGKEPAGKLNPAFISQYIELHYMENLYLDHMADMFGTTPKYFSSYFKKTFGVNFVEYLNRVRLAHARELLRGTTLSVAEIGEKTGYLNPSTFTSTFKKYYGISPSDYRTKSLLGGQDPSLPQDGPPRQPPPLALITNRKKAVK